MKRQLGSFALAVFVVLASITLRKSFGSIGDLGSSCHAITGIGISPAPQPPDVLSAAVIGAAPAPPLPHVLSAAVIGAAPAPPLPHVGQMDLFMS